MTDQRVPDQLGVLLLKKMFRDFDIELSLDETTTLYLLLEDLVQHRGELPQEDTRR